jgi:GNAT superfamily N-acetyltransferase
MTSIRRAAQADRTALADCAFRSKRHWGYGDAFMESVREQLTPSVEYVENDAVFLAEDDTGRVVGFYGFQYEDERFWLYDMFVVPEAIGTGVGQALWEHALATAAAAGEQTFFIESDPNAAGFYAKLGARLDGTRIAAGSGRVLPVFRYDLRT